MAEFNVSPLSSQSPAPTLSTMDDNLDDIDASLLALTITDEGPDMATQPPQFLSGSRDKFQGLRQPHTILHHFQSTEDHFQSAEEDSNMNVDTTVDAMTEPMDTCCDSSSRTYDKHQSEADVSMHADQSSSHIPSLELVARARDVSRTTIQHAYDLPSYLQSEELVVAESSGISLHSTDTMPSSSTQDAEHGSEVNKNRVTLNR